MSQAVICAIKIENTDPFRKFDFWAILGRSAPYE